jgi:hypothetical protein
MAVSFIGGGNPSTRRKHLTCWETLSHNVVLSTPCHEKDSYWVHLVMRRIHIEYTLPWEGFILSTPCHEKDSYWVHLAMRRIHIEYTLPWEGFKLTIIKVNKNILIDSTASNCFIVYPIDDNVNVCIKTFKVLDIYQIYPKQPQKLFFLL